MGGSGAGDSGGEAPDACGAPGCPPSTVGAGGIGLAGTFSFQNSKAMTAGEGGMVVTNDNELARRLRLLRNHGIAACGPAVMDAVLVAIALEKMCQEALTIASSGLKFTRPDEASLEDVFLRLTGRSLVD